MKTAKSVAARLQTRQGLLQLLAQDRAVGDAGQSIVPGQVKNSRLRMPALRHVFDNADQILWFPVGAVDQEPVGDDRASTVAGV